MGRGSAPLPGRSWIAPTTDPQKYNQMQKLHALLFEELGWHIAQCLELDIASQGGTKQDAFQNLKEAITLHLQAPSASRMPRFAASLEDALELLPAASTQSWEQHSG